MISWESPEQTCSLVIQGQGWCSPSNPPTSTWTGSCSDGKRTTQQTW